MPSKSRVVAESRKTEEIIQAYGHEVTPETLALFNGVLPERIIQTPSHDTGAVAARAEIPSGELKSGKTGEALVTSPIDGTAPLDYNKSRDSKPGGLNSAQTKHEASVIALASESEPTDPEAPIDAGTFLSRDLPPADIGQATKRVPLSDEHGAQEDRAKAQAKAAEDKRKAEAQAKKA